MAETSEEDKKVEEGNKKTVEENSEEGTEILQSKEASGNLSNEVTKEGELESLKGLTSQ